MKHLLQICGFGIVALLTIEPAEVYGGELTLESLKAEMDKMKADHQKEVAGLKSQITQLQEDKGYRDPKSPKSNEGMVELFGDKGLVSAGNFRLGAYGEHKVIWPDDGPMNFDPHRLVLMPSYAFNEWIFFNSELEFEHGGVDDTDGSQPANNSRFSGEVEVEQAWIDFRMIEWLNWRSLGIDLVPVGRINLYHEPTTFYSTERPEIYSNLIPSTWMENSSSIYGTITDGLKYQFMLSQGLVEGPAGSGIGITGLAGLRNARPELRDDRSSSLAYTGRLEFAPEFVPGLNGSFSAHYSPEIQNPGSSVSGTSGALLTDLEMLYRVPGTGWEFRAEGVFIDIQGSRHLVANNNATANDGVGQNMWGASGEVAYHFTPWDDGRLKQAEIVPFFRYSKIDLQSGHIPLGPTGGPAGANGQGEQQWWTFGMAFFPIPDVVLKLDYRIMKTDAVVNNFSNRAEAAVGYVF
jgi:hypothetical protein